MAINPEVPSASPLTDETDFASEQGARFDVLRDAYDMARAHRDYLIDNPDKSVPVAEYRAELKAAAVAVDQAHGAMLAAYQAPRIILGVPDETDWKAIAAAHVPIMVHTCDSEAYAAAWNDGYESAVTQGLADDPTLADDWFQEKIREAKADSWDEGVDWVWDGGPDVKNDNPYRKEAGE